MNFLLMLLMVLAFSANAEVFKCKSVSGKITYQPEPCAPGSATQGVIKVKEMTPEETDLAKAKLKAWQEQQAIEEAAKKEAEKERQVELDRQMGLELQRRGVIAQEQQALAERQRQQQSYGPIYVPAYDFNRRYRYWNNPMLPPYGGWGSSNYQNPQPQFQDKSNMFPPYQPYKEPPPPPYRSPSNMGRTPPQSGNPGYDPFGTDRH